MIFRFNFSQGITDVTATRGPFSEDGRMDGIQGVDTVLQHVWQVARRLGISVDGAMTQQILLLGDAFYGYRFTAVDFAAVWSAVDQTLKVYDREGRLLEVFSSAEENTVGVIPLPALQNRAA